MEKSPSEEEKSPHLVIFESQQKVFRSLKESIEALEMACLKIYLQECDKVKDIESAP